MKVLLVDDDDFILDLYDRELKLDKHEPRKAHDGVEALEVLTNARFMPDVILLDLAMPRLDGMGFLARIKSEEKFKKIPVVILTNQSAREPRQDAFDLGAAVYLVKSEHSPHEVIRQAASLVKISS